MGCKTRIGSGQAAPTTNVMVPNAFIGSTVRPTDADLSRTLGPAKAIWDDLIADLAAEHDVAIQEWKSYSPKAGWSLRLLRGKRTIVWLAPCWACFRVAFILGDRAVQAARQCGLPDRALQALDEAVKYPEGTGVRFLVKTRNDMPTIKKLIIVKLEH